MVARTLSAVGDGEDPERARLGRGATVRARRSRAVAAKVLLALARGAGRPRRPSALGRGPDDRRRRRPRGAPAGRRADRAGRSPHRRTARPAAARGGHRRPAVRGLRDHRRRGGHRRGVRQVGRARRGADRGRRRPARRGVPGTGARAGSGPRERVHWRLRRLLRQLRGHGRLRRAPVRWRCHVHRRPLRRGGQLLRLDLHRGGRLRAGRLRRAHLLQRPARSGRYGACGTVPRSGHLPQRHRSSVPPTWRCARTPAGSTFPTPCSPSRCRSPARRCRACSSPRERRSPTSTPAPCS